MMTMMTNSVRLPGAVAVSVLLLCCSIALHAEGAVEVFSFEHPELELRFRYLSRELRCPKCQNQSLSDSNALVAGDLRRRLHGLLHEGYSDAEIRDHMRARYGDFVLYRPRLSGMGALLWFSPLILALFVGLAWWRTTIVGAGAEPSLVSQTRPTPSHDGKAPAAEGSHSPEVHVARTHMRWMVVVILTSAATVLFVSTDWSAWWLYQQLQLAIAQNDHLRALELLRPYLGPTDAP